jgi:hypothetical protein
MPQLSEIEQAKAIFGHEISVNRAVIALIATDRGSNLFHMALSN